MASTLLVAWVYGVWLIPHLEILHLVANLKWRDLIVRIHGLHVNMKNSHVGVAKKLDEV